MKLTLKIWRQKNFETKGRIVNYQIDNISPDMSFLEMLDVLNADLISKDEDPVSFDHDCREGICGSCSLFINGQAHGPDRRITTCQLHMRKFKDGDTIYIEPFRAKAFPVIKDLVVDRSAFDREYNSPVGIFLLIHLVIPKMLIRYRLIKITRMMRLMLPPVLAVAHVLLHVKTLRLCYLLELKFLNIHYCLRDKLKLQEE